MERKVLSIKERNRTLHFKNRELRTPVDIDITGQKLNSINIALRLAGITDYEVKTISEKEESTVNIPKEIEQDVIIEELDDPDEDISLLEKLSNEQDLDIE